MIRMTQQRRAILNVLGKAHRPLSPKEILAGATDEAGEICLPTVYRNLKAMIASGGLVAVGVVGDFPRYELAGLAHHHHFRCESCDRLYDVPGCPGSLESLAPRGFTVSGHDLLLTGQCAACRRADP